MPSKCTDTSGGWGRGWRVGLQMSHEVVPRNRCAQWSLEGVSHVLLHLNAIFKKPQSRLPPPLPLVCELWSDATPQHPSLSLPASTHPKLAPRPPPSLDPL